MIYEEAIAYIKNIERAGSDYGIERMRELLILLGEPDCSLKFIHVAGTNGKGSVTAYLTSILKEAGYKVGTYNSPSVFSYNERFLINSKAISDEDVAIYLSAVRDVIAKEQLRRKSEGLGAFQPTAFEIETAVAFLCFYSEQCDICILETGLGGRWDATNVIYTKELAVITRIGLDHCALLGDTLEEIASEKAAIIKDLAVTVRQHEDVNAVLECLQNTSEKGVNLPLIIRAQEPLPISCDKKGQTFSYKGHEYRISMSGRYQLQNAALAICAAETLWRRCWDIPPSAIEKGLEKAVWHARFEIVDNAEERFDIAIPNGKTLVLDGSHNPQGAGALAQCIRDYFPSERIHIVLGVLKDKDVKGIVSALASVASAITCITPPSPRALSKEELRDICVSCGVRADDCGDIKTAVVKALCGVNEVVVLCGSLTLFENLSEGGMIK